MTIRILLFRLEDNLLCELRDALIGCHFVPAIEDRAQVEAVDWDQYDMIFCPVQGGLLETARAAAAAHLPRLRFIAVSRLPDVHEWLHAIESGAADYCAPPFEQFQLRWLMQTHSPGGNPIAA